MLSKPIVTPSGATVYLVRYPTDEDWLDAKAAALVTVGLTPSTMPTSDWKHRILEARHSPIRELVYKFYITGVPSWVATHLVRHVHAQPYVRSQRNDRQSSYDRNTAPQSAPVDMRFTCNAEELMVIANKRLCQQASQETRDLVQAMCDLAEHSTPELRGLLVPMCQYHGGVCHEMRGCGRCASGN